MTPIEEMNPHCQYGSREIFEKSLKEGYSEYAFGAGEAYGINRSEKVVALWAFYHPLGKIVIYEHSRRLFNTFSGYRPPLNKPKIHEYTTSEFQEHLQKCRIRLFDKRNLEQLLESW